MMSDEVAALSAEALRLRRELRDLTAIKAALLQPEYQAAHYEAVKQAMRNLKEAEARLEEARAKQKKDNYRGSYQ